MRDMGEKLAEISAIPLHRFLGLRDFEAGDGQARLRIDVNDNTANPAGVLHGGVAYALCDVVAYAALMSQVEAGIDAVTHDIHISVMRAARSGDEVEFTAEVVKQGKRIAFLASKARVNGELIASARVTKSLV